MKYLSQYLIGELILTTRVSGPTPSRAIHARSTPARDPLIVRFLLWLLATFGRPALATVRAMRRSWPPITPETLPILRLGFTFMLLLIGIIAATLAAKGG